MARNVQVRGRQQGYVSGNRRRRRRPRRRKSTGMPFVLVVLGLIFILFFWIRGNDNEPAAYTSLYESRHYTLNIYRGSLFAGDLCVASGDVELEGFSGDDTLHAAGLFDVNDKQVLYAYDIHERLYPASTTKIMTAYITLKYGNLDDIVTIGSNADASAFEAGAQLCGFETGDTISLHDLLCGLVLYSGNDAGVAIAEHLFGSEDAFAAKMNEEALNLGATHTHYTNSHGLHEEDHYTTAYDLYLMFNACIKDQRFLDIISLKSFDGTVTGADGTVRTMEWKPTNYYSAGLVDVPDGITVFGGKTGTTNEAGNCLVLYSQDSSGDPYISIIMGASTKSVLYNDMSALLIAGENTL